MYSSTPGPMLKEDTPKIIIELSKLSAQIDQVHDTLLQIRAKLNPVLKSLPKGPTGESGPSVQPDVGAPVYEKIRSVSSDIDHLRSFAVTLLEDIDL